MRQRKMPHDNLIALFHNWWHLSECVVQSNPSGFHELRKFKGISDILSGEILVHENIPEGTEEFSIRRPVNNGKDDFRKRTSELGVKGIPEINRSLMGIVAEGTTTPCP